MRTGAKAKPGAVTDQHTDEAPMSPTRTAKPVKAPPPLNICWKARKTRHPSRKRALSAANTSMSKNGGIELRVYKCWHCKDWHLTSQPVRL